MDRDALVTALRRVLPEEMPAVLTERLVPVATAPGLSLHVACDRAALERADRLGLAVAAQAAPEDFLAAARAVWGEALRRRATWALAHGMPAFSASRRVTARQAVALAALAALGLIAWLVLPAVVNWAMVNAAASGFFALVVGVRLLCLFPGRPAPDAPPPPRFLDEALPVYTVLAPLFRETAVLRRLMAALSAIDYPPRRLDIKLVLEEGDMAMRQAVARCRLPAFVEVILVPAGAPQTKPRALNYALAFARGELLTVYDAEDVPDPWQLRLAAERFAASPGDLACLQARLAFDNADENWLTRQFAVEYAVLFGGLLPRLAELGLPFPLGGTSNHFRVAALRQAGGWDPHNVTEDADLGFRLARLGHSLSVLDSETAEEACAQLPNWTRQRTRWMKGFLATWLVLMRHPLRLRRELGTSGWWLAQAMTLGVFASALLYPLCFFGTLALYAQGRMAPGGSDGAMVILAGVNLMVFAAGHGAMAVLSFRALAAVSIRRKAATLASLPFYWLLMSIAAWLALWQFVAAPFHWNKTEHGLSRRSAQKRPAGESLAWRFTSL